MQEQFTSELDIFWEGFRKGIKNIGRFTTRVKLDSFRVEPSYFV
jgi:hypothetical protein